MARTGTLMDADAMEPVVGYPPEPVLAQHRTLPDVLYCGDLCDMVKGTKTPCPHHGVRVYRWRFRRFLPRKQYGMHCIGCDRFFSDAYADMLHNLDMRRMEAWFDRDIYRDSPEYAEFFATVRS